MGREPRRLFCRRRVCRRPTSGDGRVLSGEEVKTHHKERIWGVYTTPGSRGSGVGRKILQAVLERGTQIDGVEQILLSGTTTQAAAIGLYRSLGFEPFGCEPRALRVGGKLIDEEYRVLRLIRPASE